MRQKQPFQWARIIRRVVGKWGGLGKFCSFQYARIFFFWLFLPLGGVCVLRPHCPQTSVHHHLFWNTEFLKYCFIHSLHVFVGLSFFFLLLTVMAWTFTQSSGLLCPCLNHPSLLLISFSSVDDIFAGCWTSLFLTWSLFLTPQFHLSIPIFIILIKDTTALALSLPCRFFPSNELTCPYYHPCTQQCALAFCLACI